MAAPIREGAAPGASTSDPRPRATPEPRWTPIGAPGDFSTDALATVKRGEHQLVVGRTGSGELFALDNRCPHEGYPLAQGDVRDCVLTCTWHNWKFDARSGACVLGGEDVRAYPVRERAGAVEVDLADPDPADAIPALLASLAEGVRRHENGRAIRDGVRLLQAGYDPHRLLADLARQDALHAEYGTTHVLAVAADCGRFVARHPGPEAMVAIAPVIDLCGETNRRLPERPRPAPLAGATADAVRRAAEEEDLERAEGLLRGALEAGTPHREVERWLFAAFSDHFTDFGHQLIYLVKARELLDRVPDAADACARELYPALLHGYVLGTRADTLPYMRAHAERLRAVEGELAGVAARAREGTPFDPVAARDAVLDGRSEDAFDAVWDALTAGVPAREVARALVGAAACRLYRFDAAIDRDPGVAETWLWATHRFTFASAVRNAVERFPAGTGGADTLRFLFQAAAFVHTGRPMDAAPAQRHAPRPAAASAADVTAAVAAREPELAVDRAAGYLERAGDLDELRVAVEDLCLHDPAVRPIVVAHAIKTAVAAFEEHAALAGHPDRRWPLLAAVRFLASPLVERRVHGEVRKSIDWVVGGVVPRKLTE